MKSRLRTFVWSVIGPDRHPYQRARRAIFAKSDGRVLQGPFAGQKLPPELPNLNLLAPAIAIGCYEREIQPIVEQAIAAEYDTFIDVGASHGYYAVGMALRCQHLRVIAFEEELVARQQLALSAKLNKVEGRVQIHGRCNVEDLERALSDAGKTLLLMDVEGGEDILADPLKAPNLRYADILLEEHEIPAEMPGLLERLRSRFIDSHDIQIVPLKEFTAEDVPLVNVNRFHVMNVNLRVPGQRFLWLTSRVPQKAAG